MYEQHRINSISHPQVVITKVGFLGEFQILQGTTRGECDVEDRSNDVLSVDISQAVAMARKILELAGE